MTAPEVDPSGLCKTTVNGITYTWERASGACGDGGPGLDTAINNYNRGAIVVTASRSNTGVGGTLAGTTVSSGAAANRQSRGSGGSLQSRLPKDCGTLGADPTNCTIVVTGDITKKRIDLVNSISIPVAKMTGVVLGASVFRGSSLGSEAGGSLIGSAITDESDVADFFFNVVNDQFTRMCDHFYGDKHNSWCGRKPVY